MNIDDPHYQMIRRQIHAIRRVDNPGGPSYSTDGAKAGATHLMMNKRRLSGARAIGDSAH